MLQKFLGNYELLKHGKFGKLCSWLISCEIFVSSLMKPSEKFVPIYMLFQNNKMFQRVVIAFPWDYQTYCKL